MLELDLGTLLSSVYDHHTSELRGPEFYNCDSCPGNVAGNEDPKADFYNSMEAPNNCVGGSETHCEPAVHERTTGLLGAEFYNNMNAPNNCVGGSETGCDPSVTPSDPAHHIPTLMADAKPLAVGASINTTSLGAGPDVYNCESCTANVAGNEDPKAYIFNNMEAPQNVVSPLSDNCVGSVLGPDCNAQTPMNQLAAPLAISQISAPQEASSEPKKKASRPSPGHFVLAGHAITFGILSATMSASQDMFAGKPINGGKWSEHVKTTAQEAADAVSPIGGFVLRTHVL